jgi:hypothetical protein
VDKETVLGWLKEEKSCGRCERGLPLVAEPDNDGVYWHIVPGGRLGECNDSALQRLKAKVEKEWK